MSKRRAESKGGARPARGPAAGERHAEAASRARHRADAAPRTRPGPPPASHEAGERAARLVWIALAVLVVARAALAFVPGTWAWSLALLRFLAPVTGWGLWALLALALARPVARRFAPLATRAGDAIANAPLAWGMFAALGAAALVALLPDRIGFVGDFMLRESTLETAGISTAQWYPQALPLDLLIHDRGAHVLMAALGTNANGAARLFGALDAALMALLAAAFARACGLRGAPAAVAAAAVFWTGALTLFTGYQKGFAELTLVAAGIGAFGVRAAREGRGLVPLGLIAAAGVALHRSALGMLPAVVIAFAFALRARGPAAWREPGTWIGLGAPLASLAVMVPRIVHIIRTVDPIHFASAPAEGGWLGAALADARPADTLNLILMLAPLAIAIPATLPLGGAAWRRRETLLLGALALPLVLIIPFVHAQQGLFRDWDDFAAAGVALALLAGFMLGETLRAAPAHAWVAVPLCLAAIVPSFQWLAHDADFARGIARVRTFVEEPPSRSGFERAMTWQYLGQIQLSAGKPRDAVGAYKQAATLLPSPHILRQWGAVATMAGDAAEARRVFAMLLEKLPRDPIALRGVMLLSLHLRDSTRARVAAETLLVVAPGDPTALKVLERLASEHPFDVAARR